MVYYYYFLFYQIHLSECILREMQQCYLVPHEPDFTISLPSLPDNGNAVRYYIHQLPHQTAAVSPL